MVSGTTKLDNCSRLSLSAADDLNPEVHIQKYLRHTRYIDELLKFFEEEQYQWVLSHSTFFEPFLNSLCVPLVSLYQNACFCMSMYMQ